MRRVEHWPEALAALLTERQDVPFAWGQNDCALFVCDAVLAMTGEDPAEGFRGQYKTRRGAYGRLKRFAGGGLWATWEKLSRDMDMPEIAVAATAGRGDVMLYSGDLGEVLGLVHLDGRHVMAVGEKGLEAVPLKGVIEAGARAFRVPT